MSVAAGGVLDGDNVFVETANVGDAGGVDEACTSSGRSASAVTDGMVASVGWMEDVGGTLMVDRVGVFLEKRDLPVNCPY